MLDKIEISYKYYELAIENDVLEKVNTIEEAEELVNIAKQNITDDIKLNIVEKHTTNIEEVKTTEIEVAKECIGDKIQKQIQEQKIKKEEEERIKALPSVNGIKIATKPITGVITSRYGESSTLRKSNHTGLDIAANMGTPIKVVADGVVISAEESGSYGNLVKISHGNNVETWYAHTSKMYVTKGESVKAGDVIATVGTTGNSTGPHLHLEIRINGVHVNPQNYLYK